MKLLKMLKKIYLIEFISIANYKDNFREIFNGLLEVYGINIAKLLSSILFSKYLLINICSQHQSLHIIIIITFHPINQTCKFCFSLLT
jgi:hypothetical protein